MTSENSETVKPKVETQVVVNKKTTIMVIIIFILVLLMGISSLVSSFIENDSYHTQLIQQNQKFENQLTTQIRNQQEAQRKQGQAEGVKICATLNSLAEIKAPTGSAGNNPSRAYEQQLQKRLSELHTDIGC